MKDVAQTRTARFQAADHLDRLGISYRVFAEHFPNPVRRIEAVDAHPTLIISIGEPVSISPLGYEPKPCSAFCVGIGSRPSISRHSGALRCIEVSVPAILSEVLWPGVGSAETPVELSEMWTGPALDHVRRAGDALNWRTCIEAVDAALTLKLEANDPSLRSEVARAWRLLAASCGQITVGDLAHMVRRSERHLTAKFRGAVGVTPKLAARRLRFVEARRLLGVGEVSLAEIACACGYSDQSHLTREFSWFAGQSPGSYRRELVG